MLNLVPVRTVNTTWEFTANTSYNITKVLSIITDKPGERITTGTHVFNGETRHVVGQEMGQIAGYGYAQQRKRSTDLSIETDYPSEQPILCFWQWFT